MEILIDLDLLLFDALDQNRDQEFVVDSKVMRPIGALDLAHGYGKNFLEILGYESDLDPIIHETILPCQLVVFVVKSVEIVDDVAGPGYLADVVFEADVRDSACNITGSIDPGIGTGVGAVDAHGLCSTLIHRAKT